MSEQIISSFLNFCKYFDKNNPNHLEAATIGDKWVQAHGQELLAVMSPSWYALPVASNKPNLQAGVAAKKTVHDFGFKDSDYHLVVSDRTEDVKAFDSTGKLLWKAPALARGVNGSDWRYQGADTPPGIYKLGVVYRDFETGNLDPAYGWYTFDMIDLEGQETGIGRAGICLHGGGSGCPDPFADYQPLLPTFGCVRMHNADLRDKVLPLYESSTIFLSVFQ